MEHYEKSHMRPVYLFTHIDLPLPGTCSDDFSALSGCSVQPHDPTPPEEDGNSLLDPEDCMSLSPLAG